MSLCRQCLLFFHLFHQRNVSVHKIQIDLLKLPSNERRFEVRLNLSERIGNPPLLIRTVRQSLLVYAPPDGVSELLMDL